MHTSGNVVKKVSWLVVVLANITVMNSSAEVSWWDMKGKYRREVTFNASTISNDLIDFPVLVSLTSTNFDFSKAGDNGEDIRFIDADGTNVLKHENDKWDKIESNSCIWVKVPKINKQSSNDFIYIYYGNSGAPDGQDAW